MKCSDCGFPPIEGEPLRPARRGSPVLVCSMCQHLRGPCDPLPATERHEERAERLVAPDVYQAGDYNPPAPMPWERRDA